MTLINALKVQDAAVLISDTRLTASGKGNMGDVAKVMPLPHLNAAIATRGRWGALEQVVRMVTPKPRDFADLRRILVEDFRGLCTAAAFRGQGLIDDTDVVVIGWDDGPQAFLVTNHDRHGHPAWQVVEIDNAMVTPTVDQETFELLAGENPVLAMNEIVARQARLHESVGGMAIATIVTEGGIQSVSFGLINEEERVAA